MVESPLEKLYIYCPTCTRKLVRKVIIEKERLTCENCSFIFWNNPKPVVSAIIEEDNKILMLQRATDPLIEYWCLPGGIMEYEETPEESVIREVKEEIGANFIIRKLIGVYRIDNDPRGVAIDIIYYGITKGKISLSYEHKDYNYFSYDNLPEKIAYKHREAIFNLIKSK